MKHRADLSALDESGSTALSLASSVHLRRGWLDLGPLGPLIGPIAPMGLGLAARLEAEMEEADASGSQLCTRELERQAVLCEMARNARIRELLKPKSLES